MRTRKCSVHLLSQAWVQSFLFFFVGLVAMADSGEVFAETCVNAQVAAVCFESTEVTALLDPIALRRMFAVRAREFQKNFLEARAARAVEHPQARALTDKWNKITASVLKTTETREEFYRSIFEDQELQGPIRIRIETRPVLRISGLPNSPRALFSAAGLRELVQAFGNPELSKADPDKLAAAMNLSLESQNASSQVAKMFNMFPLMAEFVYQLRLNYIEMDKSVVVFEDEPSGSSPAVDAAGTLYIPKSFFERFDPAEQELTLIHEAAHLMLPAGKLLMQLLMNRLNAMGPMGDLIGTPQFKQRLRRTSMDMEWNIDASVLTYLRSRSDLRRRYQALVQRSEPGSQRVAFIELLNQRIESSDWPRPPVRLRLHEVTPLMEAMALYEGLPDGAVKRDAMIRLWELILTVLPEREQAFYKPIFQLILKHYQQKPEDLIVGAGLRHKPDVQESLEVEVSKAFKEVLDRWER